MTLLTIDGLMKRIGMVRSVRLAVLLCCAFLIEAGTAAAGPFLLYVETRHTSPAESSRVALVSRFYGVELERLIAADASASPSIVRSIADGRAALIVVSADSLASLNKTEILEALAKRNPRGVNVLVVGVSDQTPQSELRAWSREVISEAVPVEGETGEIPFEVTTGAETLTGELRGHRFKSVGTGQYGFVVSSDAASTVVMSVTSKGRTFPTFVQLTVGQGRLLFEAMTGARDVSRAIAQDEYPSRFVGIAPLMMAVKSSYADRAWHNAGKYANLTIDDPWLVEPYGFLSYPALFGEMQRSHFHSTIAFIPWNFDRSESPVAALIKQHPDQWSISVHGNNHDHREFYVYKRLPDGGWPPQAFDEQAADLRAAIARMDRFEAAEGIPYDRVMIFPHTITGSMTLGLLKRYDFWATVNASNVPLDEDGNQTLEFFLRATTLKFENFPSVRRFTPEALGESDIARELFLDNPVLVYVHHDYFRDGMSHFNAFAEKVNKLDPAIRWTNLGEVTRHLYRERALDDGTREIRALSTNIIVSNRQAAKASFVVRHNEATYPNIKRVLVAGKEQRYDRSGDDVVVSVPLDPGQAAGVVIEHENDLGVAPTDVSKSNLRVRVLRLGAEARDRIVDRTDSGRAVVDWYYGRSGFPFQLAAFGVFSVGAMVFAVVAIRRQTRRRHAFRNLST